MDNSTILFSFPVSEFEERIVAAVTKALAAAGNNSVDATPEGYLSRLEASQLLKISYQMLNKRTRAGELIAYRIGTRVLYKRSELMAALAPSNRFAVAPGLKRGPKPKPAASA